MSKLQKLLIGGALALLLVGGAGAAAWWKFKRPAAQDHPAETAEAAVDPIEYKYITLDKVIVMLRNGEGETGSHYLAVDLVFKTPPRTEKLTKEHLPLLRSVAVRSLSNQTRAQATTMTVDQLAERLNQAYAASYQAEHHEMPFAEAMIGKLIVE
ncbi:flagellar basal body-associated FliL family protein [Ideonella oryzae]|uniref:Flagellar protein FliL n=1 Tax=Ideonella oryzae TaxID=2937441 RepID=A0ABT1BLI9_9BURK|nr:flagellar basal body-associated FliL family protein [Ideonella oryzae]MCO5977071.1 flagellar basal body-associated FliL family protein [Ideonella oryzae]